MKKILILCLVLSFVYGGDPKLKYSGRCKNNEYYHSLGLSHKIVEENIFEFSDYLNYYKSNNNEYFNAGINFDVDYNSDESPFLFAKYNANKTLNDEYLRAGMGIAYLINKNILEFPYRHKFSIALVRETGFDNLFISLRHVVKGYFDKKGFKLTVFFMEHETSYDLMLKTSSGEHVNFFYNAKYVYRKNIRDSEHIFGIELEVIKLIDMFVKP